MAARIANLVRIAALNACEFSPEEDPMPHSLKRQGPFVTEAFAGVGWIRPFSFPIRMSDVEEQPGQNERIHKVRVQVDDVNRRELIRMADARDLQEQMRKITERLGSSVIKVGKNELSEQKSD